MKITREKLIKAQRIYNKNYLENPDEFSEITSEKCTAEDQIDYLLSLIESV